MELWKVPLHPEVTDNESSPPTLLPRDPKCGILVASGRYAGQSSYLMVIDGVESRVVLHSLRSSATSASITRWNDVVPSSSEKNRRSLLGVIVVRSSRWFN